MIFVSYARANSDLALGLATTLKNNGVDIWLDQIDIPAGSRWDDAVEAALRSARFFLVLLTPDSVTSHNVLDEIAFAVEEKKTVVPLMIRTCLVPLRLRRLQYIDFTENFENGIEQLLRTVRGGQSSGPTKNVASKTPLHQEGRAEELNTLHLSVLQVLAKRKGFAFEGHEPNRDSRYISLKLGRDETEVADTLSVLIKMGYVGATHGLTSTEYVLSVKGREVVGLTQE